MIFTTWLYGLFFVVTATVYWLLPRRLRVEWLIGAGVVFYANYYPPHVWLILVLTVMVYLVARTAAAGPDRWRWLLTLGITGALSVLGYYKYSGMFVETVRSAGIPASVLDPLVSMRAPLAISFFVFEYVHYLIEVRRGRIGPGTPREFFLFILFFPTLICGPIKRFYDFAPQVRNLARFDAAEVSAGLERIVIGLAKKLIVADTVQRLIAPIWASPFDATRGTLWIATYGYAMQILFDFSGYSDIAIGSAQILGFHVPENFDYPYLQPNIARFWRSWHMSLTSWITDYVYIPLGGNRLGPTRTKVNRLTSMALCGLWHGAAWHFVLWGVYHGVGLNVYRTYRDARDRWGLTRTFGPLGDVVARLVTFHFVCVGWVLFVLPAETAGPVIARLIGIR